MIRVALVHDWLTGYRGGERVLAALCELYPQAEIFTLVHVPGSSGAAIESRPIHTSFLQRLPSASTKYRSYLPLFPWAVERLDLSGFDLVISTSHAVAKGARSAPGALHVSYVHTPMRYAWDQFDAYFGPGRAGLLTRAAARMVMPALRRWDVASTWRAHGLIANSHFVAGRCERFWGRAADAVVYPPVETGRFLPAAEVAGQRGPAEAGARGGYALVVSALVPYKRVDLAVRAFSRLGRKLVVAGSGPGLSRLRALAGPTVEVRGAVSDSELQALYGGAEFFVLPGVEDFGIAPVEAQAAGCPVLALGQGGALETVVSPERARTEGSAPTGCFFEAPEVESLIAGVARMDALLPALDRAAIRRHAERFSAPRFAPELSRAIAAIARRHGRPDLA
jgi:glycosyltransferase involved in cell wall biosynthesis